MQAQIYPSAIYPPGTTVYRMAMDIFDVRKKRLNELVAEKFDNNRSKFCEASGEDTTYISRIYSKNTFQAKPFSELIARRIEKKLELPRGWLDDVVFDDTTRYSRPLAQTHIASEPMPGQGVSGYEFVEIPDLANELGAGGGAILLDFDKVDGHHAYRRAWIEKMGFSIPQLRIVTVKGPSMIPYVFPGNKVLVNTGDKRIVDGEHYAIRKGDEPMIKKLFRQGNGQIRVESYNAAVEFISPGDDAEVLGLVVDRKGT